MIRITDNTAFCCDECPIGRQSVQGRMRLAEEFDDDIQFDHCACDKIDHYFYAGGYCEDAFEDIPQKKAKGKRKTGAQYRRKMERKKNKRLREIVTGSYIPHVGWVDHDFVDGEWVPVGKHVKRSSRAGKQRFIKRQTSRAIRRGAHVPKKGNGYRKHVDYWNTMY